VRKRQTEVVPRIFSPSAKFIFGRGCFIFPSAHKQEEKIMTLYEELKARGLVAQITDEGNLLHWL